MLPLIGKFQQIISLKEDFADIQGLLVNNALSLLINLPIWLLRRAIGNNKNEKGVN